MGNIIKLIFAGRRKKHVPIPCVELAVPGKEAVIYDDGTRKVYRCYQEEVGNLSITPDGYFLDRDGIISGGL